MMEGAKRNRSNALEAGDRSKFGSKQPKDASGKGKSPNANINLHVCHCCLRPDLQNTSASPLYPETALFSCFSASDRDFALAYRLAAEANTSFPPFSHALELKNDVSETFSLFPSSKLIPRSGQSECRKAGSLQEPVRVHDHQYLMQYDSSTRCGLLYVPSQLDLRSVIITAIRRLEERKC